MSLITPTAGEAPDLKRRTYYGDLAADPNSAVLKVGDTLRIRTRSKAFGGRNVTPAFIGFASADTGIASVDSSGLVTAKRLGKTLVRVWATSSNIKFDPDSVYFEVRAPETTTTAPEPEPESSTGESTETTGTETTNTTSSGGSTESGSTSTSGTTSGSTTTSGTTTTSGSTTTTTTTAPQPAPPPSGTPATSAGFPNQPSGMYIMTDRQFDSKAKDNNDRGATGSDGWDGIEYRYGKYTIAKDASAPNGDGLVGQMYYPADHTSGTAPATVQTVVWSNVRQMYVSIWAKLSSNWVGNQSSTNKMFFIGASGGNNQFFLSAEGAGSGALTPQVRLQGIMDARARIAPNLASGVVLTRGAWHRWEFVLTCNSSPGVPDGKIDFWLDGKHVTSVSDVNWTQTKYPTRPCDFPIFHWSPTYGGGGASPGADQYLWFDRVYVSGR